MDCIDRDQVKNKIRNFALMRPEAKWCVEAILSIIDHLPAVENDRKPDFCPSCGAKMDLEG